MYIIAFCHVHARHTAMQGLIMLEFSLDLFVCFHSIMTSHDFSVGLMANRTLRDLGIARRDRHAPNGDLGPMTCMRF